MKSRIQTWTGRAAACAMLVLCTSGALQAEQPSTDDAVIRGMRDELARARDRLQLPDAGKPYYLALLLNDQKTVYVQASFGALITKGENKSRFMRADVRVGDYTVDSSNMSRRSGALERLPLDDDYDVVRHDTWHAFDDAYKQAAAAYARKLAMRESLAQNPDEVADFSRETLSNIVVKRELPNIQVERAALLVKELSALAKKFPTIQSSEVRLFGASGRQVVMSSEGTFASENDAIVALGVLLRTQAPDGMPLTRFDTYTGFSLEALPAQAEIAQNIERVASELTALRDAEQAQDYTGPVLFEGVAAGQLLGYVLAPQFSGTPAPKPEKMRGGGAETELAGKLGQRVLPAGFSVVDDPTIDSLDSRPMFGRSAVDDEGMPAIRVALVQDGLLQDFLMSRAPRKGFAHSNGHAHGAMSGTIRAGFGNLIVTSSKGVSSADLYKKLLSEAKAAGQPYALIVRQLDDPMVTGDFSAMMRRGSSNVPPPAVLVKLTPDGKEQPLRGASFGTLPLAAFEDIVAAGQDCSIAHRMLGYATSIASPSLLFKRVELRKPVEQQRKLPALPHPFFEAKR